MAYNFASETLKASRGFSGSGTATYQNGDKYTGEFVNGVSVLFKFIRYEKEKANIYM